MIKDIKVITYNILSPHLCNPTEFQEYSQEDLDPNHRKNKIILLIDEWTSQEDPPIICLQEVPYSWKGPLEKLFLNRKYNFFTMSYGYKKNGYFGVSTAVPQSYIIEKIEYLPVGDYIDTLPSDLIICNKPAPSFFDKLVYRYLDQPNEEEVIKELITNAKARPNFTIKLTINASPTQHNQHNQHNPHNQHNQPTPTTQTQTFILYNYHMPCAFKTPIIQTLHLDALKKIIFQHPEIPTILATDFNLTPNSIGYTYFTTAFLPQEHSNYLPPRPHSTLTLNSTYKEHHGKEPSFTCFSNTQWGGEFMDTLDYIFISPNLKTISSNLLINSIQKCPNKINPSDHLPLQSTIQFRNID